MFPDLRDNSWLSISELLVGRIRPLPFLSNSKDVSIQSSQFISQVRQPGYIACRMIACRKMSPMHATPKACKVASRSILAVKLNNTFTSWYVSTPNSIIACQSRRPEQIETCQAGEVCLGTMRCVRSMKGSVRRSSKTWARH